MSIDTEAKTAKQKRQYRNFADEIYKEHTGVNYDDDEKKYIFSINYHEIYHTSFKIFMDNIYSRNRSQYFKSKNNGERFLSICYG